MLNFIDKLFFRQPAYPVSIQQTMGAFQEEPKVAELRAKAKAKMEEWGRKPLLEGGKFSLNNTVLDRNKKKERKVDSPR
jgi:hypothetical protein